MPQNAAPIAPDVAKYSTADVAAADCDAYWGQVLSTYFGRLKTGSLGELSYEASLIARPVAFLQTFRISGGQYQVAHDHSRAESNVPDGIKLMLQLQGSSVIEQDGHATLIKPGGWCLFDPMRPYRLLNFGAVEHVVVQIPRHRLLGRNMPRLAAPLVVDPEDSDMARVVSSFVLSYMHASIPLHEGIADYLAETTVGLVRCQLLAKAEPSPGEQGSPEILRLRIKHYIASHLADPDLSIDRIAAAMGCSKRYLHMAFAPEGITIERLIWQLRTDQCRQALSDRGHTGQSISEIAFRWGFNSSAHFSRVFKSQIGVSPSAFRRAGPGGNFAAR